MTLKSSPDPTDLQSSDAVIAQLKTIAWGMMRQERVDHTLQPSALLNETFLRLGGFENDELTDAPAIFYRNARRVMKEILIDHARKRNSQNGPGSHEQCSLDVVLDALEIRDSTSMVELSDALERLSVLTPHLAELVELKFFLNLDNAEIAESMNISVSTVKRYWLLARTKLFLILNSPSQSATTASP